MLPTPVSPLNRTEGANKFHYISIADKQLILFVVCFYFIYLHLIHLMYFHGQESSDDIGKPSR
jgi:hypothetical protein